jgi:uncharacterized phage protein (TIGR02220 family)
MDITLTTEQAVSAGMPLTHYLVGYTLSKHCVTPDARYAIGNLSVPLNMNPEHIEDVLLEYPDYFDVWPDGTVSITEYAKPLFDDGEHETGLHHQVIELFNKVNGTTYRTKTYKKLIDTIVKSDKKITLDSFEAVIRHKAQTWGTDDKMSEYNKPSTLFRSTTKFAIYLDDARIYWDRQYKKHANWL